MIPMEDVVQSQEIPPLEDLWRSSSRAVGEMVKAGQFFSPDRVKILSTHLGPELPNTCGTRLSEIYAILLHCTEIVS